MTGTETVPETSMICNLLTRLLTRVVFINIMIIAFVLLEGTAASLASFHMLISRRWILAEFHIGEANYSGNSYILNVRNI
jgi:hypothetical protein